jgi:hypothetical protein
MGDHASANGFEGQLATWIHWWSSVASRCRPALAGARSTRTRSTSLPLQRRRRRRPHQTTAAADRRRYRGARRHNVRRRQELRLRRGTYAVASLGRGNPPFIGRGTAPPLPRLSGGPRWIWAPRPLNCRTSRDNREMPNHPQAPHPQAPPIRKREASRKVGCTWPPRTAS